MYIYIYIYINQIKGVVVTLNPMKHEIMQKKNGLKCHNYAIYIRSNLRKPFYVPLTCIITHIHAYMWLNFIFMFFYTYVLHKVLRCFKYIDYDVDLLSCKT